MPAECIGVNPLLISLPNLCPLPVNAGQARTAHVNCFRNTLSRALRVGAQYRKGGPREGTVGAGVSPAGKCWISSHTGTRKRAP